jgi:hypothetical protein
MRMRTARLALAVLLAIGGLLSSGAAAAASPAMPSGMAETLEANPGSVRSGKNTVLVKPGVMVVLPSDGAMAVSDCPVGWLCTWPHSDYRGGMLAIQQGVYLQFYYWWYHDNGGVTYHAWDDPGPGWHTFAQAVTSVFNNTHSVTWAPLYSHRNQQNYYALRGAPTGYVGAKWNDSFTAMCAC